MKNDPILNAYATILACKFGKGYFETNCNLFSNIFTWTGIGYTFNNIPFWTLFKNTSSNYAFYKEFYEKSEGFEHMLPRNFAGTDKDYSFDFVIRHKPYGYTYKDDNTYFAYQEVFLSLHNPADVVNLKSTGITIQPGMSYEIRVRPTVTVTDASGLSLDPKTRNCFSERQDQKTMFAYKNYRISACHFECKIQYAVATCNCSAWNYPRITNSDDICLGNELNTCFRNAIYSDRGDKDCNCLNSCDQVTYDLDFQVTALRKTNYKFLMFG